MFPEKVLNRESERYYYNITKMHVVVGPLLVVYAMNQLLHGLLLCCKALDPAALRFIFLRTMPISSMHVALDPV